MPDSDAIIIGEDWISEYYFTTDARKQSFQAKVLERRKSWDDEKSTGSARTRFTAARTELLDNLALLDSGEADPAAVHRKIIEVLGFGGIGLSLAVAGPARFVTAPGLASASSLVILEVQPLDTVEDLLEKDAANLVEPYRPDELAVYTSAARTVSAMFVSERPPDFALVLAGRFALVAERERWAEGRYLAVDLQLVCERNDDRRGGEIDRALACLEARSLAPDAEGTIWWHEVLDDSIKHTVGVSQDLREGVRRAIEIIANDVVRRRSAAGLPVLPASQAQPLAKQSLRFLYRILFLLYAEASPELGVLPTGAPEYDRGYSLDRLRELTLVELASPRASVGTHLYESLAVLFRLVDRGHSPSGSAKENQVAGLEFRSLRADLFRPAATTLIDEVKLSNDALQLVLQHLLLSKETRGKKRGFISYAELGINQLGAVYEGLMSYTGFFAETDLYDVTKNGDASKGSWVVPVDRAEGIARADFVRTEDPITGESTPLLHERGTFVYRLAGRERQQSASYYTPEVLTKFVVSQALEELLDQEGQVTTAEQILAMTVCEPALGSGAFAIEAVRQLGEQYLHRRQEELGTPIDPDEYPRELQRVKAYLALHQVYGVDLNATAVELAEISLWLDTMVEGLAAPWFGLHLRRGNSLVGARRAVFTRGQVASKAWLTAVPTDIPMSGVPEDVAAGADGAGAGRIHHFLLPANGWGSALIAKEVKNLMPDPLERLAQWRKMIIAKPTMPQLDALVELGHRVERLWQFAWQRLQIAEDEIRRAIPLWGKETQSFGGAVTREEIETKLAEPGGAYQRLRRVMDAWNALWFWPLTDASTAVDGHRAEPPSLDKWIDALQKLLGRHPESWRRSTPNQPAFGSGSSWYELGQAEEDDLVFAHALDVATVLAEHPWLTVCERVAQQQGFFHWELDLAPVFARGGFDLQLGNPPWVRPQSDVDALLAEGDPWWQLSVKPTQAQLARKRLETLALTGIADLVVDGTTEAACTAAFVGSAEMYPHLAGLQPDLYRCFMEQTWRHRSTSGTIGLIHPETHFTDEKAGLLRAATYKRIRRHWQFINELQLFEVDHHVNYGVHIYGRCSVVNFDNASGLYHPDTVQRSLIHDGSGPEPGLRDADGNWDLRPHRDRIITVTEETLQTWQDILESGAVPVHQTRMVYAVNRATAAVLDKLSRAPRLGRHALEFSAGWHEKNDRTKGFFESEWSTPKSWDDVILQGPHLFVATPMYKSPNKTMLHNQDWSATDFEQLAPDAIPITAYKPAGDRRRYERSYTHWGEQGEIAARDHYRVAWRYMAANRNERTLIPALIPPRTAHTDGLSSVGLPGDVQALISVAAQMCSLAADLLVRCAPKSTVRLGTIRRLFHVSNHPLIEHLMLRALRLNCVTSIYSMAWSEAFRQDFTRQSWTDNYSFMSRSRLGDVPTVWTPKVPLRKAIDRRQALVEIDALVALMLGLSADELCTIYRTQFSVLYGYDRNTYFYDRNGRLVPNSILTVWRKKLGSISEEERMATNQAGYTYTYELPFMTLDREADMRQAYAHFASLR